MLNYLNDNRKEFVIFCILLSCSVVFLIVYFCGGWRWLEPISYKLQKPESTNIIWMKFLLIRWEVLVLIILALLVGTELIFRVGLRFARFRMAFFVITTMAISAVVLYIAKVTIAKVRPITSERYPHIKDSLPSGHTMMVTVIFVSLAILGFKNNFYLLGVLAFVPPIVMACSRVVAGEHFVDDIIAGWLFGITCVVGVHLLYFYYVPYL